MKELIPAENYFISWFLPQVGDMRPLHDVPQEEVLPWLYI